VHHLHECPLVIVVTGLRGRHGTPGGSTFPAVQNLLLAASGLGLGGSVFNFPLVHEAELRARLAIPDNNQIYCVVPLGYPTDRQGPVRRKTVKDVVYIERFGARWPYADSQPDDGWQARWLESPDRPRSQ
jgi:nitroreductase